MWKYSFIIRFIFISELLQYKLDFLWSDLILLVILFTVIYNETVKYALLSIIWISSIIFVVDAQNYKHLYKCLKSPFESNKINYTFFITEHYNMMSTIVIFINENHIKFIKSKRLYLNFNAIFF